WMAEVSIVLSGVNRELPSGMPVDEVRVTRRLFRSGESEYLINNGLCRLRDIREIFLDTGLELKSYAILEQGRVGDIVNSKPFDRRFLIEEAAGVVKYKVRKQEAVSKLESAQNNLQRIRDIIGEVKRQLNALDRLAKKAERYKVMQEEAKGLELGLSRRDYETWSLARAQTRDELDQVRSHDSERAAELGRTHTEVEQRQLALAEEQEALEKVQQDIYALEKRITEYDGQIRLLESKKVNLEERCGRNRERESEYQGQGTRLAGELEELQQRAETLRIEVEEYHARLREGIEKVREAEADLQDHEETLESRRRDIYTATDEMAHIRNELAALTREKESQQRNETRVSAEAEALEREVAESANRLDKQRTAVAELRTRTQDLNAKRETLVNDLRGRKEKLIARETEHDRERENLVSVESRLASLREMDQGLTGYREGVRKLVQGKGVEHDLRIESLIADV
ncbi:MAG: hypothetical protein ACWGSD_14775, partial [Thermodesulfobacteriota bacterium]